MNIAIFARDLRVFGGGEKYAIALSTELAKRGNHVKIFSYTKNSELRIDKSILNRMLNVNNISINAIKFGMERILLTSSGIRALLGIRNFDVVYSTNSGILFNLSISICCKLFGKRHILKITDMRIFGSENANSDSRMNVIRRRALCFIDSIQAPNRSMCSLLRRLRFKGKIYHIPNFIDKEIIPKIVCNKNKFIILYTGRFSVYVKGLDMLEEIIKEVTRKDKSVIFHLAGSKDLGSRYIDNLVRRYNQNVKWMGFLGEDALRRAYSESSLFVLPSRYETFGQSLLEAQQYGLPSVAFKSDGPSEIIQLKKQGNLIKPFDIKEFSESILKYHKLWKKDKVKYLKMKIGISKTIHQRYGKEKVLSKTIRMFQSSVATI